MTDEETGEGREVEAQIPPTVYNVTFFLDLARKGVEAWNEWRRDPANEGVKATFAGVDFSDPRSRINFSGFEFGDHANFAQCVWPSKAQRAATFTNAKFGDFARFDGVRFDCPAYFSNAIFGKHANFSAANFRGGAWFDGEAVFGDSAMFEAALFRGPTLFEGATFGDKPAFNYATFQRGCSLEKAAFGVEVSFVGACFGERSSFNDATFVGVVVFRAIDEEDWDRRFRERVLGYSQAKALLSEDGGSWILRGSGPNRFLDISFANARFYGEADFSGRSFERRADFTGAQFYRPPIFDGVTHGHRIDFTSAFIGFGTPGQFNWTSDSKIPLRLRATRKLAEETKNHDLERDLYIEERKAERGVYLHQHWRDLREKPTLSKGRALVAHVFWIVVMFFYWLFGDYGRSFIWPFAWLALSVPLFAWLYERIFAPLIHEAGPLNKANYKHALHMLALANALPFVGSLALDAEVKKFLFCPGYGKCLPIPPEWYQCVATLQSLISIILIFFIGLAMRNYFKIR